MMRALRKILNKANENILIVAQGLLFFTGSLFFLVYVFTNELPLLGSIPPPTKQKEEYTYNQPHEEGCSDGKSIIFVESDTSAKAKDHQSKCAQEYANGLSEFVKNSRDLYAQEGMWRAAKALVFLTGVQVLVGGFTLAYLIGTFRTQRDELGAANRTAEAAEDANRAFLMFNFNVILEDGCIQGVVHEKARFYVEPVLTNIGKTHAHSVCFKYSFTQKMPDGSLYREDFPNSTGAGGRGENRFIESDGSIRLSKMGGTSGYETIFYTGKPRDNDRRFLGYWTEVSYIDVFNRKWRIETECELDVVGALMILTTTSTGDTGLLNGIYDIGFTVTKFKRTDITDY